MFNIWKQAWRNEDTSRTEPLVMPEASDEQEPQSGAIVDQRLAGSASVPGVSDTASSRANIPSHESSFPLHKKNVRPARDSEDGVHPSDRPAKRPRIDRDRTLGKDSLAHYLPEVPEVPVGDAPTDLPKQHSIISQSYLDEVAERAKHYNTLAILDTIEHKTTLVMQLSEWAIELEKRRVSNGLSKRITLLVVTHDALAEDEPQILQHTEAFSIGAYTELLHASTHDPWQELSCNDFVIISAKLFLDSLLRGNFSLAQVNLLLLDDAQNSRDPHPMARIMMEFYRAALPDERPRILGMVTQTEDRFHYDIGVLKLEKLLDATLFGVPSEIRDEVMALPDKPHELVVFYDPHLKLGRIETPLLKQLLQIDPTMQCFRKQFKDAKHVGFELGSCAADLVWRKSLREMDSITTPVYLDDDDDEDEGQKDPAIRAARIQEKVKDTVKNWIFTMPNLDYTSRGYNVTSKFAKLVQILKACEPQGDSFRGIVFVQRRVIAHAMLDILRVLSDVVGFLRPQVITGHGPFTDPRAQQDLLEDFRLGTTNLLIATKFAEDLEIPACSCVVRFNIFESQISYAYSRARSRGRDSHLIHMAERGNDVHRRVLSGIARLGKRMQRWVDLVVDGPGSSSPPPSLTETPDPYRSDSDDEEDDADVCVKDPTTSGRIHAHNATTVIYRFVASLNAGEDNMVSSHPLFEFQLLRGHGSRNMHICTVLLPSSAPIRNISGPPCPTQSAARRAACLRTCMELFYKGFLNYNFFPRPPPVTVRQQRESYMSPAAMEEMSDINDEEVGQFPPIKHKSTGSRSYPRRQPDFWPNTAEIPHGRLYPTVISTDRQEDPPRVYQPLLILTRLPLPPIESFKLFFTGAPSNVQFQPGSPFLVDEDQLRLLHRYTIRICRAIANKPFICKLEDMAYFIAPLSSTWNSEVIGEKKWVLPDVEEYIPWDLVSFAADNWVVPLKRDTLEALTEDIKDAVIQDRWVEFTRRYDAVVIRPDLNPLSKPDDSPREANYESLVDYCRVRRKGFEGLEDYTQPLIEVARVPAVTNHLNPTARPFTESKKNPAKYLIPELCCRSTIPASTLRMALLLPSITRRLDDILLVKELNAKFFDHCITETLLHTAVSAPSAGVEFDYERLELLGDAYLKYLSSIYLFVTNPTQHEGALHISRQRIISNRSLLKNANRAGLPQYIQSKPFTSKAWLPRNFKVFRPPKPVVTPGDTNEGTNDLNSAEHLADARKSDSNATSAIGDGANSSNSRSTAVIFEDRVKDDSRAEPVSPANGLALSEGDNLATATDIKTEAGTGAEAVAPARTVAVGKKAKRAQDDLNIQMLGDKGVADVAEAIIGAAYITAGRELALRVTKALNIPVPHIDRWTDFARKTLAPPPDVSAELKAGTVEHIEEIIQHQFRRPHLLAQALTHTSIQGHEMTCYERLEFIGDAILDFLVIRYIFDRDGQLSPGALTLLKGAMVSNSTLAAVCVYSDLHAHLLFESESIANSIQAYSEQLDIARKAEYVLADGEGRLPGQYWVDIEQPKVLSDVVESVLGAIYVSDNFSPEGVEAFFDRVLKPFFDKHITLRTLSHHPTKVLFELFQSQGCQEFKIVRETDLEKPGIITCDVLCHDIILASADDTAQQFAARKASLLALDALEGDPDFMTRTCSCRSLNEARKAAKRAAKKNVMDFDEAEAAEVEEMAIVEDEIELGME